MYRKFEQLTAAQRAQVRRIWPGEICPTWYEYYVDAWQNVTSRVTFEELVEMLR